MKLTNFIVLTCFLMGSLTAFAGGSAVPAKAPAKKTQPKPTPPVQKKEPVKPKKEPSFWSGFNAGIQVGNAWNQSDWKYDNANFFNTIGPIELGSTFDSSTDGIVGGGFLGYNLQTGPIIIGAEASFLGSDLQTSFTSPFFPESDRYTARMGYYALGRGRIAFPLKDWLFSLNGGWAGSNVNLTLKDTSSGIKAKTTQWVNGWTAGAGIDYKLTCGFAMGLAYDYIQLNMDNQTLSCPGCGTGVGFGEPVVNGRITDQVASLRVSYFFK